MDRFTPTTGLEHCLADLDCSSQLSAELDSDVFFTLPDLQGYDIDPVTGPFMVVVRGYYGSMPYFLDEDFDVQYLHPGDLYAAWPFGLEVRQAVETSGWACVEESHVGVLYVHPSRRYGNEELKRMMLDCHPYQSVVLELTELPLDVKFA